MEIIQNEKRLKRLMLQYNLPAHFCCFEAYQPHFHLVRFARREVIYQKESQRQYLLFFVSGKLKVCCNLNRDRSILVCFYTSFQVLGDLEFYKIDTSAITITAVEPCLCIALRITSIRKQLLADHLFLQLLACSLADKLMRAMRSHSINLLYPLENKLASYIFQVNDDGFFSENLTVLAELLGASYRHLLRVMKQFVLAGILEKCPGGYRILDGWHLMELTEDLYLT